MNIVFFGSDNFAVPSLKSLLSTRHKVSYVVTQPDKQGGRGLSLVETAIKRVAKVAGLKIYQPGNVNTSSAIKFLKNLNPDLFVVMAYGQILSREVLGIPKIFSINIHASILPKYRGAAPINWAIINGEKTTGVTVIKMTEEMDSGPIILQETIDISDNDTSITLEEKFSGVAAQLLLDALKLIETKKYNLTLQDENLVSFAPKLKKEDGFISWDRSAENIYNLVRGCLGWPGAFTYYKGKLLKIYRVKVSQLASLPVSSRLAGEIVSVSREGIVVACGKNNLIIEELQIEGKRRMTVKEFTIGHKIAVGEMLGKI